MNTTSLLAVACAAIWGSTAQAAKPAYEVLHQFDQVLEGYSPQGLTQGPDGRFYGVNSVAGPMNGGTLFVLDKQGEFKLLHIFSGGVDGSAPRSRLLLAADGLLYGTASTGGEHGCGVIFRIVPATGTLEVMHTFVGGATQPCRPTNALIQADDGMIFGTTQAGGANNLGTVFRWQIEGEPVTLRSFWGHGYRGDGSEPVGVTLSGGRLFGATTRGGRFNYGSVFSLTTTGEDYQQLASFGSGNVGVTPYAELLAAKDGHLYGTTSSGGACCGTIYKVIPGGGGGVVFRFPIAGPLGTNPYGPLAQGPDGSLYGTASSGGVHHGGTLFQIGGAQMSALHSFDSSESMHQPSGGLVVTDGYIYGTTGHGIYRQRKAAAR